MNYTLVSMRCLLEPTKGVRKASTPQAAMHETTLYGFTYPVTPR